MFAITADTRWVSWMRTCNRRCKEWGVNGPLGEAREEDFEECFQSKVSKRVCRSEQEREEWKETANKERDKGREANNCLTSGEGIWLWSSHDSKQRESRRVHEVSVRLQTSTGEQWQRWLVGFSSHRRDSTVMHSGVRPSRRGGVRRASSRGAGRGTAKRPQLLFCCKGSSEKYSPIKQSLHRYVPTREPVLPVWHRRIWISPWLQVHEG